MKNGKMRAFAIVLAAAVLAAQAGAVSAWAEGTESAAAALAAEESGLAVSAAEESELAVPLYEESAAGDSALSGESSALQADSEQADAGADGVALSRIRFAESYTEVYEALRNAQPGRYYYDDVLEYAMEEAPALAGGTASNSMKTASAADAGSLAREGAFSETNVRTEGVDESDVVKTDGRYIYVLRHGSDLAIVRAEGNELTKVSELHVSDPDAYGYGYTGGREFFVQGQRLFVISEVPREDSASGYGYYGDRATKVATYDISDPASPVKTGEVQQDGNFREARMKDGCLYLFTEWRPYLGNDEASSELTVFAGGKEITPDRICIPDLVTDANYLVISALRPERPSEFGDSKALISGAEQLYVSADAIYAVNVDYTENRERTVIVKFTYGAGEITGRAAGSVRGYVNDTFSIDEYNGCLRVLTTYTGSIRNNFMELLSEIFGFDYYDEDYWTRHNALFVLDGDLNRLGSITDLAKGEDIRSARYFGDRAYFVTFRNTDPLFSVDLSDPRAPKVTDELKLPGFSAYLHPFGSGLLLGVGYEADESTGVTSGIKLSLFDVSGAEVVETDRTVLGGVTYLPALEEYKAIFADASKQLAGFYLDDRYLLYRHSGDGFERVLLYDFYEDNLQGSSTYSDVRGLYIGSTFYIAGGDFVAAFDMENEYAKTALLRL